MQDHLACRVGRLGAAGARSLNLTVCGSSMHCDDEFGLGPGQLQADYSAGCAANAACRILFEQTFGRLSTRRAERLSTEFHATERLSVFVLRVTA